MLPVAAQLNLDPAIIEYPFLAVALEFEDHVMAAVAIRLRLVDVIDFIMVSSKPGAGHIAKELVERSTAILSYNV